MQWPFFKVFELITWVEPVAAKPLNQKCRHTVCSVSQEDSMLANIEGGVSCLIASTTSSIETQYMFEAFTFQAGQVLFQLTKRSYSTGALYVTYAPYNLCFAQCSRPLTSLFLGSDALVIILLQSLVLEWTESKGRATKM